MSKKGSQRILIPRGLVDPNEDTIIEVPRNYKETPVVVASRSERNVNIARSTKSIKLRKDEEDFDYVMYNQKPTAQYPRARNQAVSYVPQANYNTQPSQATIDAQPPVSYPPPSVHSRQPNLYQPPIKCTNATTYDSAVPERNLDISLTNLDATEKAELQQVQDKLEAFQRARRQFLLEANQLTISKGVQTAPPSGTGSTGFSTIPSTSSSRTQTSILNTGSYLSSSTRERTRRVQVTENDSEDDVGYSCICK
ncbi:unnamed protein product [Ceutorhynchus assimilis]|uniref:Uncharacterized protein n=1 Tax=Ceutorhynchus assimilis TaxID=467358 RepID=A0A9N9MPW1_9CUCU|nr:unnamed protein product [Ceutorhynchus assimilis]